MTFFIILFTFIVLLLSLMLLPYRAHLRAFLESSSYLSYFTFIKLSLLKPRNQSFFHILVIISLIFLWNYNVVYCMEKEQIGLIIQVCNGIENNLYTPEQIQTLLNQVNSIQDPVILDRIRQRIIIIAGQYQIDLNSFLVPHLQHPNLLGENSGNPLEHTRNWSDILKALLLAGTITIFAYMIFRNWENLRDLLFEVGQRTIESVTPVALELTQNQLGVLLNNPASHAATVQVLVEFFGTPVLPA